MSRVEIALERLDRSEKSFGPPHGREALRVVATAGVRFWFACASGSCQLAGPAEFPE